MGERGNRNTDIQNASRLVPFIELAKPDVMSIWLCVYIYIVYTSRDIIYTVSTYIHVKWGLFNVNVTDITALLR